VKPIVIEELQYFLVIVKINTNIQYQNMERINMNKFKTISPEEIKKDVFTLLDKDWTLITAGRENSCNTMTASWGGMGVLWNKKVCFIVVRPTRYTYDFIEKNENFTLSFFKEKYREALKICGTKSGRDGDKIKEAGLSLLFGENGLAWFNEADLIIKCKKIYYQDMESDNFLAPEIEQSYPEKDYHRLYVGEIMEVIEK